MAAGGASSSGVVGSLFRELRSWARYLLPSKYVAVYYPTPNHVARTMLSLANVGSADTVYDMGCGDARILIAAAEEFGAKGVGVELDPALVKAAAAAVAARGLADRITIQQGSFLGLDVSRATVMTLYLSDAGNRTCLDSVAATLQPGTRVVSLYFPVQGWEQQLVKLDRSMNIDIHLYSAPKK